MRLGETNINQPHQNAAAPQDMTELMRAARP